MIKKYIGYFFTIFLLILLGINVLINSYLNNVFNIDEIKEANVGLVLGASVLPNNNLSDIFKDRLDATLELYNSKKIKKILVSGDNKTKYYDEVTTAKNYLISQGVLEEDIFLDGFGFKTYDSVLRAKEVFDIKDVIIISQSFHLGRALYIADRLDLNAQGYSADLHRYRDEYKNNFREFFARIKAFLNIQIDISTKLD